MKRKAWAIWQGGLKQGIGSISSQSGVLNQAKYNCATRFGDSVGTNPEELIAAAHAACFSMALSHELESFKNATGTLHTEAALSIEKTPQSWSIGDAEINVTGFVYGVSPKEFKDAADRAVRNCPVSKILKTKVTMNAKLGQEMQEAG